MFYLLLSILCVQFSISTATVISVYGDVYTDTAFFTKTLPWIIDNIGGEITADFYMVGSGRYGVPQMCALDAMRKNVYLQAQYLKCEAEGNPSEYCLCESGISREQYKQCVATQGNLASQAAHKFDQLGVYATPAIQLGPRTIITDVEDTSILKKICLIFGKKQPRGCIKPFSYDADGNFQKKAVAHFDKCCQKLWIGEGCFDESIPTPSIFPTDGPWTWAPTQITTEGDWAGNTPSDQ